MLVTGRMNTAMNMLNVAIAVRFRVCVVLNRVSRFSSCRRLLAVRMVLALIRAPRPRRLVRPMVVLGLTKKWANLTFRIRPGSRTLLTVF